MCDFAKYFIVSRLVTRRLRKMPPSKRRKLNGLSDREEAAAIKRPTARETPVAREASDSDDVSKSDVSKSGDAAGPAEGLEMKEQDSTPKTFKDLGIIEELCDGCEKLGYKFPTSIQREAIPVALTGKDIIGLAETGSGKTAAYALPILQGLYSYNKRMVCRGIVD